MTHADDAVTECRYRSSVAGERRPVQLNRNIKLLAASGSAAVSIGFLLSIVMAGPSEAQSPATDFFELGCDDVKGKVNTLLNTKGSVQQNLVAIKEMIFLMHVYDNKCE